MTDVDVIDESRFAEQVAALEAAEMTDIAREPVVVSGARGVRSFVLYQPIKVDGKMLTRVTLRPITGGDLDDWGAGEVKSPREMLVRLTGLHAAVIRGLDHVDLGILYQMFWDMVPDWMKSATSTADATYEVSE